QKPGLQQGVPAGAPGILQSPGVTPPHKQLKRILPPPRIFLILESHRMMIPAFLLPVPVHAALSSTCMSILVCNDQAKRSLITGHAGGSPARILLLASVISLLARS